MPKQAHAVTDFVTLLVIPLLWPSIDAYVLPLGEPRKFRDSLFCRCPRTRLAAVSRVIGAGGYQHRDDGVESPTS